MDYHVWGAMLEEYHKLQPKAKTETELKVAWQTTWEELPQERINKTLVNCTTHLTACVAANGGHFGHRSTSAHLQVCILIYRVR